MHHIDGRPLGVCHRCVQLDHRRRRKKFFSIVKKKKKKETGLKLFRFSFCSCPLDNVSQRNRKKKNRIYIYIYKFQESGAEHSDIMEYTSQPVSSRNRFPFFCILSKWSFRFLYPTKLASLFYLLVTFNCFFFFILLLSYCDVSIYIRVTTPV